MNNLKIYFCDLLITHSVSLTVCERVREKEEKKNAMYNHIV